MNPDSPDPLHIDFSAFISELNRNMPLLFAPLPILLALPLAVKFAQLLIRILIALKPEWFEEGEKAKNERLRFGDAPPDLLEAFWSDEIVAPTEKAKNDEKPKNDFILGDDGELVEVIEE